MDNSESIVWDLEPHTQAKHDILTYYLSGWFPVQAQSPGSTRVVYVDGFAGPGEYSKGEAGSPNLALQVVLQHQLRDRILRPSMSLVFLFVEEDTRRYTNLQETLQRIPRPSNLQVETVNATFEGYLGARLTELENKHLALAPSFVFIDPFGPTGFPMTLVSRLARHPKSEVLINFSYQPLNQWFLQDDAKHVRLDQLFGDERWRPAIEMTDSGQREVFLVQQYRNALEERGWRGLTFRMVNKHNQTQYHLLFGTKNYLGMLLMKRAMWSVAPEGDFQYSDLSNPLQPRLFLVEMDGVYAQELADTIWENRRGKRVSKATLLRNETAYHPVALERHLTNALTILEYKTTPPRIIDVTKADGTQRRAKSYPPGCTITFAQ